MYTYKCVSKTHTAIRLRAIKQSLTYDATRTLVHAFVSSRLDSCNSLSEGCKWSKMLPLVLSQEPEDQSIWNLFYAISTGCWFDSGSRLRQQFWSTSVCTAWLHSTFRCIASWRQQSPAGVFDPLTPADWLFHAPEQTTALKVGFKSHFNLQRNIMQMFSVAFGIETCIKTSCHWSITSSMKFCWLLITFQSDDASAHWRPSLVSDKHVPACRFQSVSPGSGALVWFSCSQGWKWMVHITVMSCSSNNCCQTSAKLLATFAFQHITREQ